MDIVISNSVNKPIYEQVYEQIVSQVLSGEMGEGEMLPSIRNLASDIRVSVITIKKAWEMLEHDGFIFTRAGKGCFVADNAAADRQSKRQDMAKARLCSDLEYYKSLGLTQEELIDLIKTLYK